MVLFAGIPALAAIVEDVFVARSAQAPTDTRELDTQKEVLVAMLLRLVDHHEVAHLFYHIVLKILKQENAGVGAAGAGAA